METINYVFVQVSNPGKEEMGIDVLWKGLGAQRAMLTIRIPGREVNFKRYHIRLGLKGL